jgi:hypothetical protein
MAIPAPSSRTCSPSSRGARHGDVEYEAANFLYWSKCNLGASEQLGFGICANDDLHGDIAYYYVVRYEAGGCKISAHEVNREDGSVRVGRLVAVAPFFSLMEAVASSRRSSLKTGRVRMR